MTLLRDSNPVPDPTTLIGSVAAQELASRRPESVVDWRQHDDGYVGDGYRIRLRSAARWEITLRNRHLHTVPSLRSAFSIVEHHRREALRRGHLIWMTAWFVVGTTAGFVLSSRANDTQSLLLVPSAIACFFVGLAALVRFLAVLGRNLDDPYRRPLPWERVTWWQRFRG